jgi:hypothetical protein
MSATVVHFIPRPELEASANLEAFIALYRRSDVLNAKDQFDSNVWEAPQLKAQTKRNRIVFSTAEAASKDRPEPALPPAFVSFAKAALVYMQDTRPAVSFGSRIAAFRFLEAALRHWNRDSLPTKVDVEVLDTAVELAVRQVSGGVAYRIAGQIEAIAEMMQAKGFISLRSRWVHGMKKPQELGSRISEEARIAREKKMPSEAVLRALGSIFVDAKEPADVLVSSTAALMLCAPERINEVLRLERNCFVHGDGPFKGKLGFRWPGSKLAEDTTKWLPTRMLPLAKESVQNLLKVSQTAHEIASWYTANPHSLYLHHGASHLRGIELSVSDVALVLWGDETAINSAHAWVRTTAKIEPTRRAGGRLYFRFDDVERAVLAMLPSSFPKVPGDAGLLCKDAISVLRTNEMHATRATYLCMFEFADYDMVANRLAIREGRDSIFVRFGFTENDGSPISLRSHSLRHYLNTLAQVGGLSSAEIAIFSGRADIKQNRAYDHRTSDEVQAPISQALKAGFMSNMVPVHDRELLTRSEFKLKGILAAHTTEFGWCMHNFASEPCQMYRDCINCEEQQCVKGDEQKEANLRRLKDETEYLLRQAREALDDEEYGADAWVRHQTKTLSRIDNLLQIMDDPDVPVGATIRLNVSNPALVMRGGEHKITFHKSQPKALT